MKNSVRLYSLHPITNAAQFVVHYYSNISVRYCFDVIRPIHFHINSLLPIQQAAQFIDNSAIRLKSTDYSATIVNISSPLTTFSFHVQVRLLSSHLQIVRCRFRCLLCCSLLFSIRKSYNDLLQQFSTHNKLLKMQFAPFSAGSWCKCSIYHKSTNSMSSASLLSTIHNSHTIHYSLCFCVSFGVSPTLSHTQ